MNFDIKYATYLQIFNFIKIKQGLGAFLDTQSWGSTIKTLNNSGCKLGIVNMLADQVGPTNQREKEKLRWRLRKRKRMNLVFEF